MPEELSGDVKLKYTVWRRGRERSFTRPIRPNEGLLEFEDRPGPGEKYPPYKVILLPNERAQDRRDARVVKVLRFNTGGDDWYREKDVPPGKTEKLGKSRGIEIAVVNERQLKRMDIGIRKATEPNGQELKSFDDLRAIHLIQGDAFNSNTSEEVLDQVLSGKGVVYLAFDKKEPEKIIGYTILVTKKLDEERIQRHLAVLDKMVSLGSVRGKYFHDHRGYDFEPGEVDLHEIAIDPLYKRRGYGRDLLRQVKQSYEGEFGSSKDWQALVRLNNIASINLLISELGMSAIGLQGLPTVRETQYLNINPRYFHGSEETNVILSTETKPIKELPLDLVANGQIWRIGDELPTKDYFFIPMPEGEQPQIRYLKPVLRMLEEVMAVGRKPIPGKDYIMTSIQKYGYMNLLHVDSGYASIGIPHFFFTKKWEYK